MLKTVGNLLLVYVFKKKIFTLHPTIKKRGMWLHYIISVILNLCLNIYYMRSTKRYEPTYFEKMYSD